MVGQNTGFKPGFGGHKFGSNFFSGVDPKPDVIVSHLNEGSSVSVFGPRRIGKSSLLAEARECLRAKGRNVIWVDMTSNNSLVKAISAILSSMQRGSDKGIVSNIKKWAENSEFIPADIKAMLTTVISSRLDSALENYVENYIESLYYEIGRQLEEGESGNKPIIIFNELTTLLKYTIDQADPGEERKVVARLNSFLGMLRHWRDDDVGIPMAISGSVSLNWLSRKHGISIDLVNDCIPILIKPMTRDNTRKLIELCVRSQPLENWNDGLTEELLNILPEFYPGIVQLAYKIIVSAEDVSVEQLNGVLKEKIYTAFWNQYFFQFHNRFREYGSSERIRANKLFDAIENQKNSKIDSKEALVCLDESDENEYLLDANDLFHHLISDSFIEFVEGGISFSSGLVPAWRKKMP